MFRILVVDDDDVIRDTLHELLSEDYTCATADTAEQAMAQLQAETYDLVLTDITMPGLSGVELLGFIRQNYSETLVILISGIGDQEHAQSLIKLGAFDFILKPFSLDIVENSVKRAIEFHSSMKDSEGGDARRKAEKDGGS